MKIGGVMASKYLFDERWNNIESKGGVGNQEYLCPLIVLT
jgi:hypothetical protein